MPPQTKHYLVVFCAMYTDGYSMEMKTDAHSNDVVKCSRDDKPSTGFIGMLGFYDSAFCAFTFMPAATVQCASKKCDVELFAVTSSVVNRF